MSEAFAAFGQNFRALFSSLLALSSSTIAASTLIIANAQTMESYTLHSYRVSMCAFALTIILAIVASYIGLSHEVNDGRGTKSLDPRQINDKKFKIIRILLFPFFIGVLSFMITLFSVSF